MRSSTQNQRNQRSTYAKRRRIHQAKRLKTQNARTVKNSINKKSVKTTRGVRSTRSTRSTKSARSTKGAKSTKSVKNIKNKKSTENMKIVKSKNNMSNNQRNYSRNTIDRQNYSNINFSNLSEDEIELRRNRRAVGAKKRKKKLDRRKRMGSGVPMIFLIFTFIGIYLIGYSFIFLSRNGIPFDTIQYGSIDEPSSVKGIIVRNETVYTSSASGAVIYEVSDNERVKKGNVICTIRDENTVNAIESDLNDINERILTMQENREDLSVFSDDVKRMNSQIKSVIDENTLSFSQYNISGIYELKSNVQKKIDSRNQMLLSENRGSLKELVEKRSIQENELSNSILNITASEGGIISYYLDGLEETFNIDKLDNITKEETNMMTEPSDVKTIAAENDKIFKIVNSNEWYIAAYVPNEYIKSEQWEEGNLVTISIQNDDGEKTIEAVINKLSSNEDETYTVLKITKDIIDYIDRRSITFEIGKSKIGFKIPKNSIVERTILKIPVQYVDDNTVNVIQDNGENIATNIINSGGDEDGTYIYTPEENSILKIGTKIVNPQNKEDIYEIKEVINIRGVYIINTGIAEFRTINMEDSIENNTHVIIRPENNPKIRLYDRIVTDTKDIVEQQNVYK